MGVFAYNDDILLKDFDTDGDIDAQDWGILREGQHRDLSGLSPVGAYLQGDLNGDGANDHSDFVMFQMVLDEAKDT